MVGNSFAYTPRQGAVASVRTLLTESTGPEAFECCVCYEKMVAANYVWDCKHIVCNSCAPQCVACPHCRSTDVSSQGVKVECTHQMAEKAQKLSVLATTRRFLS